MHPVDPEIRKLLDTARLFTALAWLTVIPTLLIAVATLFDESPSLGRLPVVSLIITLMNFALAAYCRQAAQIRSLELRIHQLEATARNAAGAEEQAKSSTVPFGRPLPGRRQEHKN